MSTRIQSIGCLILMLMVTASAHGITVRVPADYPTIQAAANATGAGDIVLVSPGFHFGANLLGGNIPNIQGTNPNDPSVVASTVVGGLNIQAGFPFTNVVRISGLTLSGDGIVLQAPSASCYFQVTHNIIELCDVGIATQGTANYRVDLIGNTFVANGIGVLGPIGNAGPAVYARENRFELNDVGLQGRFREVRGNQFVDNFTSAADISSLRGDPFGTTFMRNQVSGTTGPAVVCSPVGGGASPAVTRVHNNYIVRNAAGLQIHDEATVDNNTIALNDGIGLSIVGDPATVPIRNTIVYGNGTDIDGLDPTFNVTYSCLTHFFAGTGNIAFDPVFAEPAALDFHLMPGSPCINRGNPVYDWAIAPVDSDNDQRVRGNRIDIGADETPVNGPALLIGDLNGDGHINGLDIQTMINMMMDN